MISVVIPTLDEGGHIAALLQSLRGMEVIVADGGSVDATVALARTGGARVIDAPRGRGTQLHAGALAAHGDILWFLHADSSVPAGAVAAIEQTMRDAAVASGTFRLAFEGPHVYARAMTGIYAALQRIGLTYGDASVFVRREIYFELGGFRPLPIFEDVDFVQRLRRRGGFRRIDAVLTTSSRRFASPMAFARAWSVWIMLHALYWLGVPATRLARWYRCMR